MSRYVKVDDVLDLLKEQCEKHEALYSSARVRWKACNKIFEGDELQRQKRANFEEMGAHHRMIVEYHTLITIIEDEYGYPKQEEL